VEKNDGMEESCEVERLWRVELESVSDSAVVFCSMDKEQKGNTQCHQTNSCQTCCHPRHSAPERAPKLPTRD
jgi:hypothetical protein